MEALKPYFRGLTGNQLKIVALVAMTCDHVGKMLFPRVMILQIIGRLAFPIFAYMIAEGCVYTKSKKKYILTMAGIAALCQAVNFIALGSYFQCVLVTFTLSIGLIYLARYAQKKKSVLSFTYCVIAFLIVVFVSETLPFILQGTDYAIDYGTIGILMPLGIYLGRNKWEKLAVMSALLVLLSTKIGGLQWYGLLAPLIVVLYNGQRGKMKMKYLFYIYYPLHLVGIYLIGLVVF